MAWSSATLTSASRWDLKSRASPARHARTLSPAPTPVVRALASSVGQTAILGVPEGTQLRLATVAAPEATLHVSARTGGHIPLDAGCHGKVFVEKQPLGFDDGEFVEGVRAVAAPVTGEDGTPVACLMVVGFNRTLSMTRLRTIGRRLSREAARLSAAPVNGVKP